MKKYLLLIVCVVGLCTSPEIFAKEAEKALTPKNAYERSISAVVRNKIHYRAGKIEAGASGGLLPYESVVKSFSVGGRLTWHLSDSIGWEIIDFQKHFPSTGGFLTSTVQSQNLVNLQNAHPLMLASTSLVITPFYGKIRLWGQSGVYFDFYAVLGVIFGQNRTVQYADTGPSSAPSETILRTNWDPGFNVGLGFRFYFNRQFALSLDLRDAVIRTKFYDKNRFRSYFSTNLVFSIFLPATG